MLHRRRVRLGMVLLGVVGIAGGAAAQTGTPFTPGCPLPFEAIKGQNLGIDQDCGPLGTSPKGLPNAKQNAAKNNFCAMGTPVDLTFANFDTLQKRAAARHIHFGAQGLPPDRSVLKKITTVSGHKIGEGTLVRLVGFVLDARHSNTKFFTSNGVPEMGEAVNCKSGELDRNDIHIDLVPSADLVNEANACQSVTTEISPHFRPAVWDRFDVNPVTTQAAHGLPLKGARVRITGQLFFDASHAPCVNGQSNGPARRSLWEIHPVYAIEVFDAAKNQFVPLDQWAQGK